MIKSDKGNIELEGNLIDVVADLHVAIIGIYDSLREIIYQSNLFVSY